MKFIQVKDPWPKHEPHWGILVETVDELMEWYENQTLVRDGFRDLLHNIQYGRHGNTILGSVFAMNREYGIAEGGIIGIAKEIEDAMFTPKLDCILSGKSLLINSNGSFAHLDGDYYTILQTVESEPMEFPKVGNEKPNYLQWPGGKHWYVKIGEIDVVVDGHQKWNTKRQAARAAKTFMEEKS